MFCGFDVLNNSIFSLLCVLFLILFNFHKNLSNFSGVLLLYCQHLIFQILINIFKIGYLIIHLHILSQFNTNQLISSCKLTPKFLITTSLILNLSSKIILQNFKIHSHINYLILFILQLLLQLFIYFNVSINLRFKFHSALETLLIFLSLLLLLSS